MPSEPEIRQFHVEFPEADLTDLRRRVNATRWPERETVTDDSQGVRLALMQDLMRYWGTGHDWRECEENLNALRDARGLCADHVDAPADAVRTGRLTRRPTPTGTREGRPGHRATGRATL
jgi:epoxide hydrolase-like protein